MSAVLLAVLDMTGKTTTRVHAQLRRRAQSTNRTGEGGDAPRER